MTPTPSHPQDAGNRKRIYALTKYLQELGATIYFVYCPREWDREIPPDSYYGMNQCWDYYFLAYPVQRAVHQTDDEYFEIDAWWDVGIEFAVNWIKLSVEVDMVLCNYVFYSKVLELFDESVTKVIDTHDIVSNRNYLLEKKLGYRDFFFTSPESEKQALDRAHVVLSIKEDESAWFKCLSPTPVLTIGHLEPVPTALGERKIDQGKIKLGFIGSANPINCKNLEAFLDEYLKIQDRYGEQFSFVVGGKVCQVLDSRFSDRVQILGMVDDVAQFYNEIDIAVLPFEFSTGLKIKTVEALAWNKPCLGTVNAFEGLGSSSKYHNFPTIEELARGIEELASNPHFVIEQLEQDSQLVSATYSSNVRASIKKLYNTNWQSIRELQSIAKRHQSQDSEVSTVKNYSFNLLTNVDFWHSNSNHALWIRFWVDNARQLGDINIFRTANFSNIDADKEALFRLGLIDRVHHRELYQITDLFKIAPDPDRSFINLIDFSSIVASDSCIQELKKIQLATNHYLWYFLGCWATEDSNTLGLASKILPGERSKAAFIWDLNCPLMLESAVASYQLNFAQHAILLDRNPPPSTALDRVVIGTSCLQEKSIQELNRLYICCRDFLPDNFELVVFSNLPAARRLCPNVHSVARCHELIDTIDTFVCIEDPRAISFLVYLCICRSIPLNYKAKKFPELNLQIETMQSIESFTHIPQAYRSYLRSNISSQQEDTSTVKHQNWQDWIEYCLASFPRPWSQLSANSQPLSKKI